jgi:AraC family transcriptional regulator, positive regulator of tynA and feaB
MRTVFSTAGVHPRLRFDYWHEVACKWIVPHYSKPQCRGTFHAELQSDKIGNIDMVAFANSAMTVEHTVRQARASPSEFLICRQMAGRVALQQDDRPVEMEPGGVTLIDPSHPYTGQFYPGSKLLVLKVPRRSLEARIGKAARYTACSVRVSEPEGRLASAYLALLPFHGKRDGATIEQMIENQALDCVAIAIAKGVAGRTPRLSSARSLVRMQVRAAIESQLTDPTLDVDKVAISAGISRRYAAAVLAEDGTTIIQTIQSRRLERCREALADPMQAHRTIGEIAYGWGFSDMTHFGRRFKAAYGVSPRDYRKEVVHRRGA